MNRSTRIAAVAAAVALLAATGLASSASAKADTSWSAPVLSVLG